MVFHEVECQMLSSEGLTRAGEAASRVAPHMADAGGFSSTPRE